MEEILKCELCNDKFNLDNKRPLTVKCGHSYCATCIMDISNNSHKKSKIQYCPHCKAPYLLNIESCIPNLKLEEVIKFVLNLPKQLIYMKPGAKRNNSPLAQTKLKTQYNCGTYPKGYQLPSSYGFGHMKQSSNKNHFDEAKNNFSETIETIPACEDEEETTLNISFKDDCKELLNENIISDKGENGNIANVIKSKGKKLKEIASVKSENVQEFNININNRNNSSNKQNEQHNNEIKINLKSQISKQSLLNNSNNNERINTMPNNNNNNNNINIKSSLDEETIYKLTSKTKTNNNSNTKNQKNQINMTPQTHNPFKPKMISLQKKTNLFINNYPLSNTNHLLPNNKLNLYTPYKHPNPFDKQNPHTNTNPSNDINKTFQKLKNELMLYLKPSLSKQNPFQIQNYEEQIYKTLTHPKFKDNLSSLTIRLLPPQELYIGNSSYGVVYSSNGEYHEGKINLW